MDIIYAKHGVSQKKKRVEPTFKAKFGWKEGIIYGATFKRLKESVRDVFELYAKPFGLIYIDPNDAKPMTVESQGDLEDIYSRFPQLAVICFEVIEEKKRQ